LNYRRRKWIINVRGAGRPKPSERCLRHNIQFSNDRPHPPYYYPPRLPLNSERRWLFELQKNQKSLSATTRPSQDSYPTPSPNPDTLTRILPLSHTRIHLRVALHPHVVLYANLLRADRAVTDGTTRVRYTNACCSGDTFNEQHYTVVSERPKLLVGRLRNITVSVSGGASTKVCFPPLATHTHTHTHWDQNKGTTLLPTYFLSPSLIVPPPLSHSAYVMCAHFIRDTRRNFNSLRDNISFHNTRNTIHNTHYYTFVYPLCGWTQTPKSA